MKLEKPITHEFKATNPAQTIEIYIMDSTNEIFACGKFTPFDKFIALDHGPDNQTSIFDSLTVK